MKVLFVIKNIDCVGGTERVTTVIANELSKRGHDAAIVSLAGNNKPFFKIEKEVKLHYVTLGKDKRIFPFRDLNRYNRLKEIFKKENPDIIIIVDAGRNLLKIPASRGYKTIVWEHFDSRKNWHLLHGLSRRIGAKYADYIVTLTSIGTEDYKTRLKAKKAITIYNPITINPEIGARVDAKTVVGIGRYTKQKGYDMLIKAWSLVKNKNGYKLQIVGQGEHKDKYVKLIEQYNLSDSVELLPPTKDVIGLYNNTGIYALSSRDEGLPLVLIEASAMGCPIVSFDCPTGPKEIVKDGYNGFLVENANIGSFAEKLQELINNKNLRTVFSENGIKLMQEKFSVNTILNQWEKLFNEILNS